MFKNYLKTAWRNLIKNKMQSAINIAGLSVGLTCSILIFLWVQNELSIDAFHAKGDRLYKVYEREYYQDHIDGNYDTPGPLAEELKRKIPEIEDAVMLQEDNELTTLRAGDKLLKASGSGASAGFFNLFSYPLLQGGSRWPDRIDCSGNRQLSVHQSSHGQPGDQPTLRVSLYAITVKSFGWRRVFDNGVAASTPPGRTDV
jgi:hypothetical protein